MFQKLRTHPLTIHLIFWIGYVAITASIFTSFFPWHEAWQRLVTSLIINATLIYANLYWLIPDFLMRSRYLLYYALLFLLLFLSAYLMAHIDYWLGFTFPVNNITYFSPRHYSSKLVNALIVLAFSSMIKVLETRQERILLQQELINYKLDAELKLLKSQISPHFLFNSLNNIYAMVYINATEAAPMILKLSEMMRYVLYGSNEKFVSLTNEVQYLNNYIALNRLRKQDQPSVTFEVNGNMANINITPLLFIPFLENAYKHGNVLSDEKGWVRCSIHVEGKHLTFHIENSLSDKPIKKDLQGGIGLENTKKRLALMYPNKHQLTITNMPQTYKVNLMIDLS